MQRYAVWFGGSMLGSTVSIFRFRVTRQCVQLTHLFMDQSALISSRNSMRCAILKLPMKNMDLVFVAIIRFSVQ